MPDEKILYNGMTSVERGEQHRKTLRAARAAVERHGYRKVTGLVVAAIMSDGSIILEGSGPVGAITQLGQLIYFKATEGVDGGQ